jgi:hypothetical protein
VEEEPGEKPAEGQGRTLDQEARQEFLRLQEPRECGAKHMVIWQYDVTDVEGQEADSDADHGMMPPCE